MDIHKNANGAAKINNLISIYLKAKLTSKAQEEKDSILDKIPSIENILKSFEEVFKYEINEEKEISFLKISLPSKEKKELI